MPLHIPQYMLHWLTLSADYQVNMIAHNNPGIQPQPFLLHTVFDAIDKDIFIFCPGKHIYPAHHRKCDEIGALLVMKFIIAAHGDEVMVWVLKFIAAASLAKLNSWYGIA